MLDQLVPARGRVDVDLDDAGIGGDAELLEAGVTGGRVAFRDRLPAPLPGDALDDGDQLEIVLELADRGQEDMEDAASGLEANRGADQRRVRPTLRLARPSGTVLLVVRRPRRRHRDMGEEAAAARQCLAR